MWSVISHSSRCHTFNSPPSTVPVIDFKSRRCNCQEIAANWQRPRCCMDNWRRCRHPALRRARAVNHAYGNNHQNPEAGKRERRKISWFNIICICQDFVQMHYLEKSAVGRQATLQSFVRSPACKGGNGGMGPSCRGEWVDELIEWLLLCGFIFFFLNFFFLGPFYLNFSFYEYSYFYYCYMYFT